MAWADSELFHLGPVVAAQQVHHQTQKLGDVYMCTYCIYLVYVCKYNKKQKNCDMLPSGGLFPLRDLTHPSLPLSQSRSVKGGGGATSVYPRVTGYG